MTKAQNTTYKSLLEKAADDQIDIITVAAVIVERSELLLAKRSLNKVVAPGKWHIPGGKIEEGETPEQALEREIYEELGSTVGILSYSNETYDYLSKGKSSRTLFFFCERINGQPFLKSENVAITFCNLQNLSLYRKDEALLIYKRLLTGHPGYI